MWPYMYGYGYGGAGLLPMVLFWVVVIAAVILLVRYLSHSSPHAEDRGSRALDILKERYAKGEITKKEYEEMKKDIG